MVDPDEEGLATLGAVQRRQRVMGVDPMYADLERWVSTFIRRVPSQSGDRVFLDRDFMKKALPKSDLAAAERVAMHFNELLTFGTQSKQWRMWNGKTHQSDNSTDVQKICLSFANVYAGVMDYIKEDVVSRFSDGDGRVDADVWTAQYERPWKEWRGYKRRLWNVTGQGALSKLLQIKCGVDEALFDAQPDYLVLDNGVIDLDQFIRDGGEVTLLDHDPSRLVTDMARAAYDPNARTDRVEAYIASSLPDVSVARYAQKWVGASMLGKPKDKGLINLIGSRDSGKSLFLNSITYALGDYGLSVRASVFLEKKSESSFEENELRGVRLVTTSEPSANKKLDEEVVKRMTGQDRTGTRAIYGKTVYWTPMCTIFIASNSYLKFDCSDEAMLLRIKPIRFPNRFSRTAEVPVGFLPGNPDLEDQLKEDKDGILLWALEGLRMYLEEGLGDEPEAVTQERLEMAKSIDTSYEWVHAMLDGGYLRARTAEDDEPMRASITFLEAKQAYKEWCAANGHHFPVGVHKFEENMKNLFSFDGVDCYNSGGKRIPGLLGWYKIYEPKYANPQRITEKRKENGYRDE